MNDYSVKDHIAYKMGFKAGQETQAARIAALEAAVTQCRTLSAMLKPQADRIAALEAALRKVAEWERLLGLADSWITAAIECKEWRWDADQHEAATLTRDEIRAALAGEKDE